MANKPKENVPETVAPETIAPETIAPETIAPGEASSENINLEDITKQVAEILAEARKEAEKIIADAKATVSGKISEEQKQAKAEREAYWNELVEVKLFKDNNKYKDDVFVSVNGENCVIKRGERVKVKRKFAAVLDLSDMQDYETSLLIEKKSGEFAQSNL